MNKMKVTTYCPFCNGENDEYVAGCSNCGGTGEVEVWVEVDFCPQCGADNGPVYPWATCGEDRVGQACCVCSCS